ncbi:cysteine desulfurase family protein [Clostridium folliculivorans]|uniref:Cysteine desulfurase n=1 Tax=Clostridium folliculivorans TaxID=2886038 RepID=A0A9W5Y337_9CLOT|nr:cysteine desulfurase family protein [Clostridium folliculivorans]GKU25660.1 cysteine desulfurase [Clostridium folliculivorans]GKU28682.1 cysteine desulfurase [Clostridium folliculivorans]
MEVYFDNSATTRPTEEVIEAVSNGMREFYGNPSSLHKMGIKCDRELLSCREKLASLISCTKEEIYFTSGGSESNNMIIKGITKPGNHIIISNFEHPSVLSTCKELEEHGVKVTYLDVNSVGQIDIEQLEESICKDTVLVSIMHVNNEIGAIQDLERIGNLIKERSQRAKFHVDAVQSFGKIKIDVKKCKIDMLSVSAHKIHGPKGIGFCYIRKGLSVLPLISGGGQEKGFRSGTENLPSALGMVKAAEEISSNLESNFNKVTELKRYFIDKLQNIKDIKINSPLDDKISPYVLNVSFIGVRAEVLLHLLEEKDIYVSTGSACSSRHINTKGSHVLNAIGLTEKEITGAIRFSFSSFNTIEEVDYVIEVLRNSLTFLRRVKI